MALREMLLQFGVHILIQGRMAILLFKVPVSVPACCNSCEVIKTVSLEVL